jgi:biopolymer transport protein TolR
VALGLPPSVRRGRRGGGRRAPVAEINVTPLVDVMLVLLIIFMVTAPLLVTGVKVKLPETRAKALDADAKPTVLSVNRDGGVFINDQPITPADMPQALIDLRTRLEPDDQLFLRADAGLDYGAVMRVMGELNRAGLDRVALVTTGDDGAGAAASVSAGSAERP